MLAKDVKQWKLSHTAGGHVKWHNHSGKKPGSFLKNIKKNNNQKKKNLNIHLPFQPAVSLLRIYPREIKMYAHKSCTKIFIVTLLILAPNWK